MKKYIYARATACGMSGRETVTSPARPYQKKKDIPVGLYISTANLHRKVDKIFELYLLILLTRRNYYGIIFLTVTVFQEECPQRDSPAYSQMVWAGPDQFL